jgi:hypothetical protein
MGIAAKLRQVLHHLTPLAAPLVTLPPHPLEALGEMAGFWSSVEVLVLHAAHSAQRSP